MKTIQRSRSMASGDANCESERDEMRLRISETRRRWSFEGLGKEGSRRKVRWR